MRNRTIAILFAVFALSASAAGADEILTPGDWEFLKAHGYGENSSVMAATTPDQCIRLHALISDAGGTPTSVDDAKKWEAVQTYLANLTAPPASFGGMGTPTGFQGPAGPCKN